jgi:hypothetical protein
MYHHYIERKMTRIRPRLIWEQQIREDMKETKRRTWQEI